MTVPSMVAKLQDWFSNFLFPEKHELQDIKTRDEALFQALTNGVIMFDAAKQVLLANPAATRFTGLPAEGYYLPELYKLFPTLDLEKKVDEAIKGNSIIHIEEVPLVNFFFEIFIVSVRHQQGDVFGGAIVLHDITHSKEIDRAKTDFVSLASHQLRTPLTSINWYIEMLQGGDAGVLNDKQKEFLSEVYKGSQRMVQLVSDLLNVSRLETGRLKIEPVPTDLVAFIQEVRKELESQVLNTGCQVVLNVPEKKIEKVNVDQVLLRQVIVNLLTNAIRYSSVEKKGQVTVSFIESPKEYTIRVKDNGIGIPKGVQGRIFEKFFRADNARATVADGNGLGLYLAKQIMDSSGGTIGFSSSGQGTTFYVTVPVSGMKSKAGEKGLEI